jgi:hypothetical protein
VVRLLAPHIESSVARMAALDAVLCIQDTTELGFNGQEASGLGPPERLAEMAAQLPPTTRLVYLVYLAYRGADIMALMLHARSERTGGLVCCAPDTTAPLAKQANCGAG